MAINARKPPPSDPTISAPPEAPVSPATTREQERKARLDRLVSSKVDAYNALGLGALIPQAVKAMTAEEKATAKAKEEGDLAEKSGTSFAAIQAHILAYRGKKVSQIRTALEDKCTGSKGALNAQIDIVLRGLEAQGMISVEKGSGKGFRNYTTK